MRVGIIGAGRIGGTLARGLAGAGHAVLIAARDAAKLDALAATTRVETGEAADAAGYGDGLIVATPFGALPALGRELADALAGRIVIDATNPYPGRDGPMAEAALAEGSLVATARHLPGARIAKAFNTLMWTDLGDKGGQGFGMAVAGDAADALALAQTLVRAMGFEPVVAGGVEAARRFDPGRPAYGKLLTPDALRAALADG